MGISIRTFERWTKGDTRPELSEGCHILRTRTISRLTKWGVANRASVTMAIYTLKSQLRQYDRPDTTTQKLEITGKDGAPMQIVALPMVDRSVEDWEARVIDDDEKLQLTDKTAD
jgi:hypothetical protein